MGFVKFVARRTIELVLIILLLLFLPRIPPNAKISEPYTVTPARPFEGSLKLNEKLNDVELWHKGDFLGPEAFADYKGELYTTIHGGDVVKLVGNHITPVVKFGRPCKGYHEERICGRPLGLAFDRSGALYVADAYYGLFKVDVTSGKKERLVAVDDVIERNVTLPNSVTVASNGDLYWTDSSTEFRLEDGIFDMLADGSGRLIHYDAKTKKNKVLIPNLHFANGVALSEDESFVLVSETARNRLHRYYLKGPKKGTSDIFIDGLPGMPDNLKSDGKGGFLVPLVIGVDADNPGITQIFGPFPLIRKLLARALGVIEFGFKLVNDIYPNEIAQKGVHAVGHFSTFSFLRAKRVTVLHVNKEGEILDSIHCLNKKITGISEAHVFRDTLYLGSPFNDYIARIPLNKVGWEHLKPTPKPTTTTPKPTTTTPKPTTTTPKPTTTTPKPTTTTTPKPTTTTTPKPTTTTTPKPTTTTTPKPTTTTTPKPTTTTTPKPTTTTTTKPTTTTTTTTTTTPKRTTVPPKPTPAAPKPAQTPPGTTQPPPTTPPPAQAQPVKDQAKAVPVNESPKTKN